MSPAQIRDFVGYFYTKPWVPEVTSPVPLARDVTFLGTLGPGRRIARIERGEKGKGC